MTIGDQHLAGQTYGTYQIWMPVVLDVKKAYPEKYAFLKDARQCLGN